MKTTPGGTCTLTVKLVDSILTESSDVLITVSELDGMQFGSLVKHAISQKNFDVGSDIVADLSKNRQELFACTNTRSVGLTSAISR